MSEDLKKTNLHQWHVEHGGRMVPFAGWEMPVQYPDGPIEEHRTTRQAAGLFDIDHMGQLDVRGSDAEAFVNYLVTYDVRRMALFDAHYAMMCYADGTIVDDVFVYKLPDERGEAGASFLIVINAANRAKDVRWAQAHTDGFDVTVTDVSDETYMLAFQGPLAPQILNRVSEKDLEQVERFTSTFDVLFGEVRALLGRTGYTGEDGFELYFAAEQAEKVWRGLLEAGAAEGVKAVGLAARDSLRFEPCMPLYGHEISETITPVQAQLNFALSLDKPFIGRDALLKQKLEQPERVLVGFEMVDRGVPREHYAVVHEGEVVGEVTTGMFAPTVESYVGMAYVPRALAKTGTEIEILIRDRARKAKIVKRPFYTPAYRR